MPEIEFVTSIHKSTKRDYLGRVNEADKSECSEVAKRFDRDYWDGERKYGYGGYRYDGRWRPAAEKMASHYELKAGDKILDVGCGKGFLLHEFTQTVPGIKPCGIDISEYAIKNAKDEIRPFLHVGKAQDLPFENGSFDLVYSLGTLHNLKIYDLKNAVMNIERVSKGKSYIMVESYRNEREKMNLLYWQLTCECFYSPSEWEWLLREWGYSGDWGYIFFE